MVSGPLKEILEDRREFMRRLFIEDMNNEHRRIRTFLPEQEAWIEALLTHQFVLAVKPRQLGFSTVTLAFLMVKALLSRLSRRVLSMVHEEQALERFQIMTEVFYDGLPDEFRTGYAKKSLARTSFVRRDRAGRRVPGPSFTRLLAGARGQGRSWTYNDYHATEMAHWPTGTSAKRNQEGRSVDEEAFSSVLSTIHDPDASVIVESTGNGPRGLFYDLYRQALSDPKWAFVFQKWTDVPRYCHTLTDEQSKKLEADLDSDEAGLRRKYGVTLGQLSWRRQRMRTFQMTPLTFRRQFPLVHLEPFLNDEHGWFDQEALLELLQFVPPLGHSKEALRVFHKYDPARKYSIGQDTAGGVGRDEGSLSVLRDDAVQAAVWNSNRASPKEQGVQGWRVSNMFGRAPVCCELNNHGQDVIDEMQRLGVPLWTPPPLPSSPNTPRKPGFWSSGDGAGNSKRAAMVHMREVVREGWVILNDALTVQQCQTVVEKPDGKIEAQTGHDDRCYANALALWQLRAFWSAGSRAKLESERDRIRRILAGGNGWR